MCEEGVGMRVSDSAEQADPSLQIIPTNLCCCCTPFLTPLLCGHVELGARHLIAHEGSRNITCEINEGEDDDPA